MKEIRLQGWLEGLVQGGDLAKMLEISKEQKVRLRRISTGNWQNYSAACEDAKEKSLAVLTAAQRQKLRAELDRRGAW